MILTAYAFESIQDLNFILAIQIIMLKIKPQFRRKTEVLKSFSFEKKSKGNADYGIINGKNKFNENQFYSTKKQKINGN
jgi:hypothetical protein